MVSSFVGLGVMVVLAGGRLGVGGARYSRAVEKKPSMHEIAGVPILNYDKAYGGRPGMSATGAEENWVVVMRPDTTDDQIEALCAQAGQQACSILGHQGGMPFLMMRGAEDVLEKVLKASGGTAKFVEPDQKMRMIPEFDEIKEEMAADIWGLDRIGVPKRASQGSGVHVYILDTGVRVSHSDFDGRAQPTLDMGSGSAVECDGSSVCARDSNGHGTHCAGTSAGRTYGIASKATIHAVKVLGDDGSGSFSWIFGAMDWVARNAQKPAVGSMSLGARGTSAGMVDAVNAMVNAGVAVVVAAGNSNDDACGYTPAGVHTAITVGSTNKDNKRSYFSNYGSCTNIWAPGSGILSAGHTSDDASQSLSGTSMACPHVAGGAALVLEGNPSLTPAQVQQGLLDSAITDAIGDLKSDDTNKFLYVGAGAPPNFPTVAPPTAPPPSGCDPNFSTGPDFKGDCTCLSGLYCYQGGAFECEFSFTMYFPDWKSSEFYSATCTDCVCKEKDS